MPTTQRGTGEVPEGEDLIVARREARLMLVIWLIQSAIMVGIFLLFGYNRTEDPFGLPFGLPGWYVFGGIIPAIVFLFVIIYVVRNHFKEVDVR